MFDIGFFEIALISVVLLVVMGPERLPEVARQIAFVVRKVRNWVYSIKDEMNLSDDPMMKELKQAKDEFNDFGRDMRQLGNDFSKEASKLNDKIDVDNELIKSPSKQATTITPKKKVTNKKVSNRKVTKKTTKKVSKKVTAKKKVSKQAVKKETKKVVTKKATAKKATTGKIAKKVAKKATKKIAKKVTGKA